MNNTKLIFLGTHESQTQDHELQLYVNDMNNIYITIDSEQHHINDWICLDKETAIKLSKVLKSEISKLQ